MIFGHLFIFAFLLHNEKLCWYFKCDIFIQSFTTRQHCTSNNTVTASSSCAHHFIHHTLRALLKHWQEAKLSLWIADRTASQHLRGHMTSSVMWLFDSPYAISYWWSFGTKPLSLTVSEIFNLECHAMVDMTLIRPVNEGQGHSFWYQSISHIRVRFPIGSQW